MTRRSFVRLALTLAVFLWANSAWAANKFWVGGTGNLDGSTTTHISDSSGGAGGAVYPSSSDTLIFDGSSGGGTVTVTAAVSMAAWTTGAFTGTINTNGQTIALSTNWNNAGTGTRTMTFGASAISTNQWLWGTPTNLTFNANTSTITVNGATQVMGGLTYSTVVLSATALQSIDGGTYGALTRTSGVSFSATLTFSGDVTVTGTFTVTGNDSAKQRILVQSSVKGTQRTITTATIVATNADFQDIVGAGAASWDLSASTGLSGDCGGNTGITFTTPATNYWIGDTGSFSSVAEWASTSGGASSSGRVPLCQDTARFDANSFSTTGFTVTQDMPRTGSIDFTGATNSPTFTTNTAASVFGSITLISGMTLNTNTQSYVLEGRGTHILTSAGNSWAKQFTVDAVSGTYTLQDAFTATKTLILLSGTFDIRAYTATFSKFTATGSITRALSGSGTFTCTEDTPTMFNASGSGFTPSTSMTINLTAAMTADRQVIGNGLTYGNIINATTGAFAVQFTGSNTFHNITVDTSAADRTIQFTAGATTTLSSISQTSNSHILTIGSITAATHTLVDSDGGTNTISNGSISYSIASPASTFYAPGGTDGGNNTNWVFTAAPAASGVKNMMIRAGGVIR